MREPVSSRRSCLRRPLETVCPSVTKLGRFSTTFRGRLRAKRRGDIGPLKEVSMNKSELLNWLQQQNLQWEAFLDQIGEERMDQPGVAGDWSIKDIIAHLAVWQRGLNARLQAALRGEAEPPPFWPAHLQADDELNAWIYAARHGSSVHGILNESREVLQQLLAVI